MKTNGFGLTVGHKGVSSLFDFDIKLKTLIHFDLPTLRSIWAKDSLEQYSLQIVRIFMCCMLKTLPLNLNTAQLRSIEGQKCSWCISLVWKDDISK